MPENPIIQEGGSGRRMGSIGRIITFGDGGNDIWVPASERLTAQKFISKNGVYLASDEELFAFSKLTVNVYGGAPGMTVPTTPTGPYGVETPTGATPAEIPAIPGGVGSAISGIDPTDGQQYTAKVNPDGTISKVRSPTSIKVLIPPAKKEYVDGDKIDYNGLVIELLDANGERFTDSNYPDGTITWSPVKQLPLESKPYLNLNVETPIDTASGYGTRKYYGSNKDRITVQGTFNGPIIGVPVDSGDLLAKNISSGIEVKAQRDARGPMYVTAFLDTKRNGFAIIYGSYEGDSFWNSWSANIDGHWFNYFAVGLSGDPGEWSLYIPRSADNRPYGTQTFNIDVAYTMLFGTDGNNLIGAFQSVTVQWTSPYDGMMLSDTFDIMVQKRQGTPDIGGDIGGDTGGGGGGHGF